MCSILDNIQIKPIQKACLSLKGSFQVVLIEGKLIHLYTTILIPFEQLSGVLDAEQVTFKC